MTNRWKVIMEGEERGEHDDWSIEFMDAEEIIGVHILKNEFFDGLIENLKRNKHYHSKKNIKCVRSTIGEIDLSKAAIGAILCPTVKRNIKLGFLYGVLPSGNCNIIGLWDEDFAKACNEQEDLFRNVTHRLIKTPNFFRDCTLFLPILT